MVTAMPFTVRYGIGRPGPAGTCPPGRPPARY